VDCPQIGTVGLRGRRQRVNRFTAQTMLTSPRCTTTGLDAWMDVVREGWVYEGEAVRMSADLIRWTGGPGAGKTYQLLEMVRVRGGGPAGPSTT